MPVNVFGDGAVQTAYVSYRTIDLTTGSQILIWPTSYVDNPNVLAASMTVETNADNENTITLPDARQASVGQNFIITNIGLSSFTLNLSDGTPYLTIPVTEGANSYWVQLTDNSTMNGTWQNVGFGSGTTSADAILLAGLGLKALGADPQNLNTDIQVEPKNANYSVLLTDRAKLIVWTGATETITLPSIDTPTPNGFYVSFNNEGTGVLTIATPDGAKIDGSDTLSIQISQSLTIICDGANWWSLGFGQNTFNVVTVNTTDLTGIVNAYVDVSVNGSIPIIQKILGNINRDTTIYFPISTSYWYIQNSTVGAYKLFVQLGNHSAPVAGSFLVPQGTQAIFYSDGFNMYTIPNSFQFSNGTLGAPSVSFTNGTTTGLYYDATPFLGVSVNGTSIAKFLSNSVEITKATTFDSTATFTGAVTLTGGLSAALPIASGGTGQTSAASSITALMPTATVAGTLAMWNGGSWVILPPGADGTTLKIDAVTHLPTWTA